MIKYLRLAQAGGEGFGQRDWAVVHLNTAICMQFLDRLDDALEKVNQAIKIDPAYEKAYYRRLQILQEQGNFKAALHEQSIPAFIKNQEIHQLKTRILQQYTKTLGLSSLLDKLKDKDFIQNLGDDKNINSFVQGAYENVFQAISSEISQENNLRKVIQNALCQHYCFLKSEGNQNWVQTFCTGVRSILLSILKKQTEKQKITQNEKFLEQFWNSYASLYCSCKKETIFHKQNEKSSQNALITYFECSSQNQELFTDILASALRLQPQVINIDRFIQFVSRNNMNELTNIENMQKVFESATELLQKQLNLLHISQYQKLKIIVDSIFKIGSMIKNQKSLQLNNFHSVYCFNKLSGKKMQDQIIQIDNFLTSLKKKQKTINFADVLLVSDILQTIPLSYFTENKGIRDRLYEIICEQINKINLIQNVQHLMKASVLLSLSISIDPLKNMLQNPQIPQILLKMSDLKTNIKILQNSHKQIKDPYEIQARTSLYLRVLSMSASTHSLILQNIYKQVSILLELLDTGFNLQKQEGKQHITWVYQVKYLQAATRLVYLLTVDHNALQQQQLAQKMGVNVQDISKARKLQGEDKNTKNQGEIQKLRQNFIKVICESQKWSIILLKLASLYNKVSKDTVIPGLQAHFANIFKQLSAFQPRKFYHPNIVKLMLNASICEVTSYNSGLFFSKIAKSSNPNIFNYKDLQAIANSLSSLITNAKHQIHAFQALLGLISLSSTEIKVQLALIEDTLLQQNQYIVHAGLQLLNNMLIIYGEDGAGSGLPKQKYLQKIAIRISHIVHKYYLTYRQQVITASSQYQKTKNSTAINTNFNDYAHPLKIYGTLVSILMLLDSMRPLLQHNKLKLAYHRHQVKELVSWEEADQILSQKFVRQAELSVTLFKLAMHHSDKLPRNWHLPYKGWISCLKGIDYEKWAKLQKYMH